MNIHTSKLYITAAIAMGLFSACEPEIDRDLPDYNQVRGDADFSVYVALGNSLTAGYADGALNRHGQINSYPNIMAEKMAAVTPDFEFNLPLLPEGIANGTILFQGIGPTGLPNLQPSTGGLSESDIAAPISGNFHNLGIPGAKVGDLTLAGYGSSQGNPYFARFASEPTTTLVQEAVALNPTFFTLWIGNNDVLGYATQGGEGTITPVGEFEASMEAIINQLTSSNSSIEGAIANIPSVSKTPYFNTVPWNAFNISAEQATAANAGYQEMIDPVVRAGVDSAVLIAVIHGVVSEGARRQIIDGVVEEGARQTIREQARQPVANGVATQVVYQTTYDAAIEQNATPEEAEDQANAYISSQEGQEAISTLASALLSDQAPDPVQDSFSAALENTVEEQLNTEEVQNEIATTAQAAYSDLEVLGPEGAAAVNSIYNAESTQAQIEERSRLAYENRENMEDVLGSEGAAAVDQNFTSDQIVQVRQSQFTDQINQLKAGRFYPQFSAGPNGFVVYSEQSPTGIKQLTANEKMIITFLSQTEYDPASGQPVPDRYALDQFELAEIDAAISAYNSVITNLAQENSFALVNMNAFFEEVANGYTDEGTTFTPAFISGNAFSLDGVHLTQKGYALVAKKFIQEINRFYGSQIPEPKLANYPTIALPEAAN